MARTHGNCRRQRQGAPAAAGVRDQRLHTPARANRTAMRPELESLYRTAPIGLGVLDTELRFVRVNERLAEMNGLPAQAHVGHTVRELLPGLADQAEAVLQQVLRTGQPVHDLEVHGTTPAQPGVERIWVEQFTPLHDDQGRLVQIGVVAQEVTEQRRAQAELQRGQAMLAVAMEAAGLAVWEWDVPTNALRFGANWEQILGYEPAEMARSRASWHAIMHPADRDATNASIEAHVAGKTAVYECEYRLRHADGHWVWVASRGRVVERDAQGRPLRMIGVGRDVGPRRQAQLQLQQQAQMLALAFDAIFAWTDEGGIEFWNRGAELQYGHARQEALGRHPDQLLHTVFPCARPEVAHALASQGVWRGELLQRTRDGRVLTVNAVMQQLSDGTQRILEITRDVTEVRQKQARLIERERELRRSQERLQVALDAGRMGVWDWKPGDETFWSAEVYKLMGLAQAGTQPQPLQFLQMVHPDDRARLDAEVARVLAQGGDYEAEFRIVRADGEVRWLVSRGRVMADAEGRSSRVVGVNFDISERKAVEQALEEADRRRSEFLAMLAHELRNPLAPISNAVRLLEVVGDTPERRVAATQILRRQTTHLARLVDDLLEVSRITQGRIELRMENVLLATTVFQAVEAARPLARERATTIEVDVPPALDIVADPARLTQIVSNLVTNAVKYTPEGGRVEVSAEGEPNDRLSIAVQDNGPGIAPELRPRIFELFTQDQRTLDRSQGGLGIGLALVQRLAELHGGQVRCENRRDGRSGARFVVCLPRKGRRAELRGSPVTATRAQLPPLPILVIDDNRDAALTLASLLRLDGHRVEVAHDGEQALAAAARLQPRVLLLDLGLPKLDGLAVARRLRADTRHAQAVLIAMSGYAQARDREASAAAGFDAHFAKPVELADIYRAIEAKLR
jgi:PAS domain S-box-containing protein